MGLFTKPLLPAHYENEDVQISAELCPNIAIIVVGLARGEITILSGKGDMIHVKTSVQAKESIIRNAAALEPVQDGDQYTYTIHTPLEEKLEKAVTFQVFVTIPKSLDSLESLTIQGTNLGLSIGNISHTFIKNLSISTHRGDTTIESFYGESAIIKSIVSGGICGKFSVARLHAQAKSGKIMSTVHLLNTDEAQLPPKVICSTLYFPVRVAVDGTDIIGPFTVEAKTQCQPLDVKILLASTEQRLRGNFINFGAPTRIKLSRNYQGRIETRTHYGKITVDGPEFERIEGAVLSLPSPSDRITLDSLSSSDLSSGSSSSTLPSPSPPCSSSSSSSSNSTVHPMTISQGSAVWDRDDRYHQPYLTSPNNGVDQHYSQYSSSSNRAATIGSTPAFVIVSGADSRANSTHGSITETRSEYTTRLEVERKKKKDEEKELTITKEVIGTVGNGGGLVMAKNSSGDIAISLI
ncbi:hypothetical protein BGZ65_006437 [Modicella reniformis]|uniref:Adhesin domain-containing protein n=1 Tax=Modicella reniformis TaxID=1440133 RepID=A0A9P6LRC8_9FUNG|nr:hypothetical protein BGZ65_006437 [Modicella reniformis]